MATLYITEFNAIGGTSNFVTSAAQQTPVAEQTVAIGAAAQSSTLNANTTLVRLHCDAICSIQFGASPSGTVTTAKMRMAANQTEYFAVNISSGLKVGVISNS
jgi:hypothetical protein